MGKERERGSEGEREVQNPGHPMALCNRAWGGVPGRHCAELLLTWFRNELPITFSLGLTLESPPPLPHSPLSYHHLFFNLSNRPCSFSFSTARLTAFLETIKHTRQTGWANLRRFVCFFFSGVTFKTLLFVYCGCEYIAVEYRTPHISTLSFIFFLLCSTTLPKDSADP